MNSISSAVLSTPSPKSEVQFHDDDSDPFGHVSSNRIPTRRRLPPIDVGRAVATLHMNRHGPSSSLVTLPTKPGLTSPPHPSNISSPKLLAATPPTPTRKLSPALDDFKFPLYTPASASLYPEPVEPWELSHYPGLILPSHLGKAAYPELLAMTPLTPSTHKLSPALDDFRCPPVILASASPYLEQVEPWELSHPQPVRTFAHSFCLHQSN